MGSAESALHSLDVTLQAGCFAEIYLSESSLTASSTGLEKEYFERRNPEGAQKTHLAVQVYVEDERFFLD